MRPKKTQVRQKKNVSETKKNASETKKTQVRPKKRKWEKKNASETKKTQVKPNTAISISEGACCDNSLSFLRLKKREREKKKKKKIYIYIRWISLFWTELFKNVLKHITNKPINQNTQQNHNHFLKAQGTQACRRLFIFGPLASLYRRRRRRWWPLKGCSRCSFRNVFVLVRVVPRVLLGSPAGSLRSRRWKGWGKLPRLPLSAH